MWIPVLIGATATGMIVWWWQARRLATVRAEMERLRREASDASRAAESNRAAESARLEDLLNSLPDGAVLLHPSGRIRHANSAVLRLLAPAVPAPGQTLLEAFRLPVLHELVTQRRTGNATATVELSLAGASPRLIEARAVAFRGDGGPEEGAVLVVFRDLTELRRLENHRREFVANVSHELRTPLSMIKGFVETLLGGAKDDPTVAGKFLQTIERHADRLGLLIDDLLTLSRLESGQIAISPQPVDLSGAAAGVLEDYRIRAQSRGVTLVNEVPGNISAQADVDRLQQVLSNLVDNAIKYGREGGTVRLGSREDEGMVVVSVRDDGPGIPPEARDRIFERFFRADRARSREAGGTGLGLAIVKHLVQSHGGRVWVESEVGRGTSFCFTLPRARPT